MKEIKYENEPTSWTEHDKQELRNFLIWATKVGANDINFVTSQK